MQDVILRREAYEPPTPRIRRLLLTFLHGHPQGHFATLMVLVSLTCRSRAWAFWLTKIVSLGLHLLLIGLQ